MGLLFENALVVTLDDQHHIFDPGYVLVEGRRIREVGQGDYRGDPARVESVDSRKHILIPGLINAHTHSYANLMKGMLENLPLEIWVMFILAAQRAMKPDDVVINATLGCVEMLKRGMTCCLDNIAGNLDPLREAAEAYRRLGQRVVLAPMFGDIPYNQTLSKQIRLRGADQPHLMRGTEATPDSILAMVRQLAEDHHRPEEGIMVAVSPSGPQRCSDALLLQSMELAESLDVPWHTHLLESRDQEVAAYRLYGASMVRHLYDLGLLKPRVSVAHGVWLNQNDMALFAASGASIIMNPASNLMIGSGIPSILRLREAGVSIGIGSDGAASTGCQSMFEVMKLTALLGKIQNRDFERWPTAMEVLEMATLGNARALGLDDRVGSLEPGKEADIVFLRRDAVGLTPLRDVVWQLVYGNVERAVDHVLVAGRKIVEGGRVLNVDESRLYDRAQMSSAKLLDRCQKAFPLIESSVPEMRAMLQRAYEQPSRSPSARWQGEEIIGEGSSGR